MKTLSRAPVLAFGTLIAIAFGAADLAGGGSPARAGVSVSIILAWSILVTVLGRRSETMSVLAGRPVDERWEHINLEASAYALAVSGVVVLGAFVVADATGGDWQPYALIAVAMAVSYLGALLLLRARH
jgi:Predicted membrane protein (DUF2178)